MRGRGALAAILTCAAWVCCTPVGAPHVESLRVRIDADEDVQAELDEVVVLVESRTPQADSWDRESEKRFNPDPTSDSSWPLEFVLMSSDPRSTYQVTATARDQAGAITIQARSIMEPSAGSPRELRVRLDRECLRRPTVCGRTLSCSFGECVDAREPLRDPLSVRGEKAMKVSSLEAEQTRGAAVSTTCAQENAHTCATTNEAQPLVCQQGVWTAESACPVMMRCDSAEAETHGSCQPIAPECMGRNAGDLFCDADGGMQRCEQTQIAHRKPCGENEHCVDVNHDVRCACLPGFVPDALGCVEARDCKDSGGCDPLTKCEMQNSQRVCTPCPAGFAGTGAEGCAPLLSDLQVSPGVLEPSFDPNIKVYHVRLPLLIPTLSVTARSETGASLSIDNANASLDVAWQSPVLAAGSVTIPVVLRASSGVRSDYQIIVEHDANDRTYFKGSNCQRGGWFGEYFAVNGNTMVVGAPLEALPGSRLSSAGAVYVYVLQADQWRLQQAILPPEPVENGSFGMGVDIWGDRIVVGEPGGVFTVLGTGSVNGSAYTYVRNGDTWSLEQTIRSGNPQQSGDAFGFRVALRESDLIISAPFDDEGGSLSGAIYTYVREGSSWQQLQRIKQEMPVAQSHYGVVVVTDGVTLVIGATHETIDGNTRAGAAYVYERKPDRWSLVQRLLAPTVRPMAQFGYSAATLGDTLIVAAPSNPQEAASVRSGEVHIFKREAAGYKPVQVLENTEPRTGDYFGNGVSLNAKWLAVGAARDTPLMSSDGRAGQGTVHLYARAERSFVRAAQLHASVADAEDHFGDVVALADDYIAIGVREEDGGACGINTDASDNSQPDSGAVIVLR